MEKLYKMTGTSRQWLAQYGARKSMDRMTESQIVSTVKKWRKVHPMMGSRPLYHSILAKGEDSLEVGINKFEKIVSDYQLGVKKIKGFIPLTSDGKGKGRYKNLTNGLIINDINILIVGDITYFDVRGEWQYIFTLKDVYSQRILSLTAGRTLKDTNAIKALSECEQTRTTVSLKGCIHHTDNGSQYNSHSYRAELDRIGMKISRSKSCKQNGSAEQLNHIIKNMYLKNWNINSFKELAQACKELEYLNNHERAIAQLNYKTPIAFERYIKDLPKNQKPIKVMYDFNK